MTKTPPSPDDQAKSPVRQRVRTVVPKPLPATNPKNPPDALPDDQVEKVGYRNPPKHSRFKPGFDPRRPRGRKPGSTNKANSIVAMMESPTTLRTPDGGVRTVSTADAMARKLRELGLSGDLRAISKSFELYEKRAQTPPRVASNIETPPLETSAELSASDQAILEWFEEETKARLTKGPKP